MLISVFCLVLLSIGLTLFSESSFPSSQRYTQTKKKAVCWWEVSLQLSSKGKYMCKQNRTSYAGEYAYALRWTGCMEQDQEDFILYHEDFNLLRWEPLEKKESSTGTKTLSAKGFIGKPCFELNYILAKGKKLFFDFMVKGIKVPQHCSKEKLYLHFPASKENTIYW